MYESDSEGVRVNVWSVLGYIVNSLGFYRGVVLVLFKVSIWIIDIKVSFCLGGDFFLLN